MMLRIAVSYDSREGVFTDAGSSGTRRSVSTTHRRLLRFGLLSRCVVRGRVGRRDGFGQVHSLGRDGDAVRLGRPAVSVYRQVPLALRDSQLVCRFGRNTFIILQIANSK